MPARYTTTSKRYDATALRQMTKKPILARMGFLLGCRGARSGWVAFRVLRLPAPGIGTHRSRSRCAFQPSRASAAAGVRIAGSHIAWTAWGDAVGDLALPDAAERLHQFQDRIPTAGSQVKRQSAVIEAARAATCASAKSIT